VYSYTYTLTSNYNTHTDTNPGDGDGIEGAADPLNGDAFAVRVTDSDTDVSSSTPPATSIINVTVLDDAPIANDDTLGGTQPENAPVLINVFANDLGGADGVDIDNAPAVKVSVVGGTLTGTGNLVYNNNGTFTYTPSAGESGAISFQYHIVDGDGDVATALVTFTIAPDSVPTVTAVDLTVDEQGLPAGTGEMADLNAGNNSDPSEKSGTGTMTITTGGDTLSKVEVQDKDGAWIDVTAATVGVPISVTGTKSRCGS
jgi:hypothetical protein